MDMKHFALFIFFLPLVGYAHQKTKVTHPEVVPIYELWLTGPLLAPTPVNLDPGHPSLEPSITIFDFYGSYDTHWKLHTGDAVIALNLFVDFQFAFTKNTGVEIQAGAFSNFQHGKNSTHFEDTAVLLGFQLAHDKKDSWVPDVRFIIEEIFPTGNFQKFDPDKVDIEATGEGSFQTGPVLAFQKLFYFPKSFLTLRGSVGYFFPTPVKVKGFNTFGGGFGTKGRVKVGQTLLSYFSGEYSFSQRWVFAFDTQILFQGTSTFSGKAGVDASGLPADVGNPWLFQLSFAPQIEYNFSATMGIIGGLWFSLFGRNSDAFGSAFFAFAYVF